MVGPAAVSPAVTVPLQVRRRRRCGRRRRRNVVAGRPGLNHVTDRDEERGSRRHLEKLLWFQL